MPTDSLYPQEEIQYIPNGKKMLIIEPFKSIVESKFNRWKEHVHLIYGTQNDDIRSNKNIFVAIIDKVQSSVELGPYNHPRFDYIVIDESHLLTMSEYRRNCGLLLDYLKNKTIQSKIIYMTGTPLFERQFLPENAWYEWSRQWVVAAWYLRERGYQVNINPWVEFVENSKPKDQKEQNQEKTEKRNLKYDNFNRIIKTQADDIAYLYANVLNTRFEIQRYAGTAGRRQSVEIRQTANGSVQGG